VRRLDGEVPKGSAQAVLEETTIVLPLEGLIDIAAERARLAKDRDKLAAEAKKIRQKLANADFVSRAPEEVVAENRERLEAAESEIARLQAALDRLGSD
jgi:valyl-tRNA synthetase